MKSMTGFGSIRVDSPLLAAAITLKSLNNRYLELSLNIPASLAGLERRIRDYIQGRVHRGKVELTVKVLGGDFPTEVIVDTAAAASIASALRELASAAGINEPVRLSHLLGIEGMLSFQRNADADRFWAELEPALDTCVKAFDAERHREGRNARTDMETQLKAMSDAVDMIALRADDLDNQIIEDLRKRFRDVVGDLVDEGRIMTEVASYLAKHTINEELVRLRSHLEAFSQAMDEDHCGKKLDFICQELNRESNTIGSKSAQIEVSSAVIRMKDAIENIREQVRNVE